MSVYIGFIDLEKAFNNVNWDIMFKIVKQKGKNLGREDYVQSIPKPDGNNKYWR